MKSSEILGDTEQTELMDYVAEHMQAVIMIPGCGEKAMADHKSIDQLCNTFLNLKWVGLSSAWFMNGTDISDSEIKPGIEKDSSETNEEWGVSNYNRDNAYQIYRYDIKDPSTIRYGGTIPDKDLISFIDKLREKGSKVAFYPLLMIDNEDKEWRGNITGKAAEVESFYSSWYKPFIIHYAKLLKDKVDMFYLGSELEGLTTIKGEKRNFPFIDKLVNLSYDVRNIMGNDIQISYAANWTEYHSCNGGYRPLDDLWSSKNINFVGINYYMPLTDTNDSNISYKEIKDGFNRGEGTEYYYSAEKKISFTGSHAQWKNLQYWYNTDHWGWDSETTESYKTSWNPKSKPIIFSEFGFCSIDKSTNTPSVYGRDVPKYSTGETDYLVQLRAIKAALDYINETPGIQFGFYYGWDTRGIGWQTGYVDGKEWEKGHWIDGKIKKTG